MKHAKLLKSLIIITPVLALASPLIILSNTGCGNPAPDPGKAYSPDGSDWVGRTGGTLEYSIDTNNHTYTITGNDDFTADDTFTIPQSVVIDNVRYLVTTIGELAFRACTGLTGVDFGSVTTISDSAFRACTGLTGVDLGSVTTIGGDAFRECTGLTNVDLNNVTTIGDMAFYGCAQLTEVELNKVTAIGNRAFWQCPLSTINIDPENEMYKLVGSPTGGFIQKRGDGTTLNPVCGSYGGIACGNIVIPGGFTTIGDNAFAECTGLTGVDFGSVTTIGEYAFLECTGLTGVDLGSVTTIVGRAFQGCVGLSEIDLTSVTTLGMDWCYNCTSLSSVIIGTQTYVSTDDGWDSVGPETGCILYAPNETVADAFKADVITDAYADKWTYQEI